MTVAICSRGEIQDTQFMKHDVELLSVEGQNEQISPDTAQMPIYLMADYSLS
jgi:hypothetical protein